MKFTVTMKTPDALDGAIAEATECEVAMLGLSDEDSDEVAAMHSEKAAAVCERWFAGGETLTVEVDTDAGTCVVVPVG